MILEDCYQTIIDGHSISTRSASYKDKDFGSCNSEPLTAPVYHRLLAKQQFCEPANFHQYWKMPVKSHLQFITSVNINGLEKIIAVSYLGTDHNHTFCKLFISVEKSWHEKGLGEIIARKLLEFTHQRGMKWLYCDDDKATQILANKLVSEVVRTLDDSLPELFCLPSKNSTQLEKNSMNSR